jgi:hypothetical protein
MLSRKPDRKLEVKEVEEKLRVAGERTEALHDDVMRMLDELNNRKKSEQKIT